MKTKLSSIVLILIIIFVSSGISWGCYNEKPVVYITCPVEGAEIVTGIYYFIEAVAEDSDGDIVSVDFYDGAVQIGHDTSRPYKCEWNTGDVPAGSHILKAVAYDDDGAPSLESTVNITIVKVLYVDTETTGHNTGKNWVHPFKYLQDALDVAVSGDQIWVAAGTYYPDDDYIAVPIDHQEDQRSETFQMKAGVAIYGGFAGGYPNGETSVDQRNLAQYRTILSGDIDDDDGDGWMPDSDNSYHIVTGASNTVLDGFRIIGGTASGQVNLLGGGGGMFNNNVTDVRIINCEFTCNNAGDSADYDGDGYPDGIYNGGAIYNKNSTSTLIGCLFAGNSSAGFTSFNPSTGALVIGYGKGGAIYNTGSSSSIQMINCTLSNNLAGTDGSGNNMGGGVYLNSGELQASNSIFWNNRGVETINRSAQVYVNSGNATLNYCCINEGWASGTNNSDQDPCFVETGRWTGAATPGSIILEATIRDFKKGWNGTQQIEGGHPDFERTLSYSTCTRDLGQYLDGLDEGMVMSTLNEDLKPVYYPDGDNHCNIKDSKSFSQWYNDDPIVNMSTLFNIVMTYDPVNKTYIYSNDAFFPIDNQLFGNQVYSHNYHFTFELHTTFVMPDASQGSQSFKIYQSDDDLWLFIDDSSGTPRLVLDLGGLHPGRCGHMEFNSSGDAVVTLYQNNGNCQASGQTNIIPLGLIPGQTYGLHLFFAERHTYGSQLHFWTTLKLETSYVAGDYHLKGRESPSIPGSPCIDAGDNDAVPNAIETDLDGFPRFIDDPVTTDSGAPENDAPYVDMGAYEYQIPVPIAADDVYSILKNEVLNIAAPGVLANDEDPLGDPITSILVLPPSHGSLTTALNANGSFAYTPATDYVGIDSFTYKAQSTVDGRESVPVTVTIIINDIGHHVPVASAGLDRTFSICNADESVLVTLDGSGSTDSGNDIVTYLWSSTENSAEGKVVEEVPFSLGSHDVTLTVRDSVGDESTDTMQITIDLPAAPIANPGSNYEIIDGGSGDNDQEVNGGADVVLDGLASTGSGLTYIWYSGGGEIAQGVTTQVRLGIGVSTIGLLVIDECGRMQYEEVEITVNWPPITEIEAGEPQGVCLPFDGPEQLHGLDTAESGITQYEWQVIEVPLGGYIISWPDGQNILEPRVTLADEITGEYKFLLIGKNSSGGPVDSDATSITVRSCSGYNAKPAVSAWIWADGQQKTEHIIVSPTTPGTVILQGTIRDDGQLSGELTGTWEPINVPIDGVEITPLTQNCSNRCDTLTVSATATFKKEGTYQLALKGSDGTRFDTDVVIVYFGSSAPPQIWMGENKNAALKDEGGPPPPAEYRFKASAELDEVRVTERSMPKNMTLEWTVENPPAGVSVTFSDETTQNPTVTFKGPTPAAVVGPYKLILTATDPDPGVGSTSGEVWVNVYRDVTIQPPMKKSVFAITDHGLQGYDQTPEIPCKSIISAFEIDGDHISWSGNFLPDTDTYPCGELLGPVGLAIDPYSKYLFITHESLGGVQIANGTDMSPPEPDESVIAPESSNLAGIVFDKSKQKIYTVDRDTSTLYVYSWDSRWKTLVLNNIITLGGGLFSACGLALDETLNILYVTEISGHFAYSHNVYMYNTNDWSFEGVINVNKQSTSIAAYNLGSLGENGTYIYTSFVSDDYFVRSKVVKNPAGDLELSESVVADLDFGIWGIAVDHETGLCYVTTKDDKVIVYNGLETNWAGITPLDVYPSSSSCDPEDCDTPGYCDIEMDCDRPCCEVVVNGPAGIVVGDNVLYKPTLGSITKKAHVEGDIDNDPDPVSPIDENKDEITYEIIFTINNSDMEVYVIDTLPVELDFIEASDQGIYDAASHMVKWCLGDVSSGYSRIYENGERTFQLKVRVNEKARQGKWIFNDCKIEGATRMSKINPEGPEVKVPVAWWTTNGIVYVNNQSYGGNGTSWANAYMFLQDALDEADKRNTDTVVPDVKEIWVANSNVPYVPGSSETDTFAMEPGVNIYGGFKGTETSIDERDFSNPESKTILSGGYFGTLQPVQYVVTGADNAVLDGFTISGGKLVNVYCNNTSPTISNCVIENSQYDGIYYTGTGTSPVIKGNKIRNNYYYGIRCNSVTGTVQIINNMVYNNGHNNSYSGIKLEGNSGTITIRNNTIVHNDSGIWHIAGSVPTIRNCIIWENGDNTISYNLDSDQGVYNVSDSVVGGYSGGPGTIYNVNPEFVDDDYHIRDNSPCIDKGNNDGVGDGETDIDGEARKVGRVDIGADEFPPLFVDAGKTIFEEIPVGTPSVQVNFTSASITSNGGVTIPTNLSYKWVNIPVYGEPVFTDDWILPDTELYTSVTFDKEGWYSFKLEVKDLEQDGKVIGTDVLRVRIDRGVGIVINGKSPLRVIDDVVVYEASIHENLSLSASFGPPSPPAYMLWWTPNESASIENPTEISANISFDEPGRYPLLLFALGADYSQIGIDQVWIDVMYPGVDVSAGEDRTLYLKKIEGVWQASSQFFGTINGIEADIVEWSVEAASEEADLDTVSVVTDSKNQKKANITFGHYGAYFVTCSAWKITSEGFVLLGTGVSLTTVTYQKVVMDTGTYTVPITISNGSATLNLQGSILQGEVDSVEWVFPVPGAPDRLVTFASPKNLSTMVSFNTVEGYSGAGTYSITLLGMVNIDGEDVVVDANTVIITVAGGEGIPYTQPICIYTTNDSMSSTVFPMTTQVRAIIKENDGGDCVDPDFFTDYEDAVWSWSGTDDSLIINQPDTRSPIADVTINRPGNYDLTLVIKDSDELIAVVSHPIIIGERDCTGIPATAGFDSGCLNKVLDNIGIGKPVSIYGKVEYSCVNTQVEYFWSCTTKPDTVDLNPVDNEGSDIQAVATFTEPGDYPLILRIVDAQTHETLSFDYIFASVPEPLFHLEVSGDKIVNPSVPLLLTAEIQGGTPTVSPTFEWSDAQPGNISPEELGNTASYTFPAVGSYDLTVTANVGDTWSQTAHVTVHVSDVISDIWNAGSTKYVTLPEPLYMSDAVFVTNNENIIPKWSLSSSSSGANVSFFPNAYVENPYVTFYKKGLWGC